MEQHKYTNSSGTWTTFDLYRAKELASRDAFREGRLFAPVLLAGTDKVVDYGYPSYDEQLTGK